MSIAFKFSVNGQTYKFSVFHFTICHCPLSTNCLNKSFSFFFVGKSTTFISFLFLVCMSSFMLTDNGPGVNEVAMKVTERTRRYKYKANLECGGRVAIAPTLCLSRPCGVRGCACLRQVNRKTELSVETNTPELAAVDFPFDFGYQKPRLG